MRKSVSLHTVPGKAKEQAANAGGDARQRAAVAHAADNISRLVICMMSLPRFGLAVDRLCLDQA